MFSDGDFVLASWINQEAIQTHNEAFESKALLEIFRIYEDLGYAAVKYHNGKLLAAPIDLYTKAVESLL